VHLFEPQAAIKWNRFDRRGETLGEMVRAVNPPVGATIYYYLKADAQKVMITIKDLEGNTVNEFTPTAKKGLQKAFWNLNRQAAPGAAPVDTGRGGRGGRGAGGGAPDAAAATNPDQPPQAAPAGGGGRGGRGGFQVDPGVFKVTLTVDGKEVETKKLTISPDPLFR
jgi:hypothetical protein